MRAVVRVVRKFNLSTITQDIVLARDARRVDFVTHVDWHETERMLKTAFYADVLSPKATTRDAPYQFLSCCPACAFVAAAGIISSQ